MPLDMYSDYFLVKWAEIFLKSFFTRLNTVFSMLTWKSVL